MTKEQLEALKLNMQKSFAAMKEISAKITEEEDKDSADRDAEVLKTLQGKYTAKHAEWEASKSRTERAVIELEGKAEQDKLSGSLDKSFSDGEVDTKGKTFGNQTPAAPIDHYKEIEEKGQLFLKYLSSPNGYGSFSGNEQKAIMPKSENFKDGAKGAVAPPHIVAQLFGTDVMRQLGMQKELNYLRKGTSTMVSSSNTLGGYTVPQDFRLPVLELPGEEPFILSRATVIPAPTGSVTMPKATQSDSDEYGGFAGSWISEGGLKTKTDTTFEQETINTHEYAAYTQISTRLLERSAIAMEAWISRKGRAKIMNELNRVFLQGTGVSQPTGILTTAGIHQVNRAVNNQVSREDIIDLKRALQPYHRGGGIFIMGDDVGGYLEKLTVSTTDLRPLFSASMANGPYDRLVGYPYIETTQVPALGTEGDISFVDLREYYVAMENEVVIKRSDDYDIVHNLATIVIYIVVGGQLVEPRVCAELDTVSGS